MGARLPAAPRACDCDLRLGSPSTVAGLWPVPWPRTTAPTQPPPPSGRSTRCGLPGGGRWPGGLPLRGGDSHRAPGSHPEVPGQGQGRARAVGPGRPGGFTLSQDPPSPSPTRTRLPALRPRRCGILSCPLELELGAWPRLVYSPPWAHRSLRCSPSGTFLGTPLFPSLTAISRKEGRAFIYLFFSLSLHSAEGFLLTWSIIKNQSNKVTFSNLNTGYKKLNCQSPLPNGTAAST